ncbi:MAG: caspase family protein [bacterium]
MLKKALLIGINEYPDVPLRGCVNDVMQMKEALIDLFGFAPENIQMILDREATQKGVVEGLDWLAQGGNEQAVRVFHYAGHGHFVPDKSGDEPDGADEALVPYDHERNGYLIDDHLKELYDRFPANGNLTLIMDCCHSGTNQRDVEHDVIYRFLPVSYADRKAIAEAKRKFLQAQREFVLREMKQFKSQKTLRGPDEEFEKRVMAAMQSFKKQRYGDHRVREGNVLIAACQSDQKAADAKFDKTYHGAFTFFLVKLLRETEGRIPHLELVQKLGDLLDDHDFKQIPQLECLEGRNAANLFAAFS